MPLFLIAAWRFVKPILTNPYVLAAIAIALALWYAHHRGYESGKAACEAAHAAAVQHETKRIQIGDNKAVATSNARTANDKKADANNGEKVRYVYIHAHEMPQAATPCIAPDVADSLRAIH